MFNKSKIKAILFDLDGTLVDSEPVGPQTFADSLKKCNVKMSRSEWGLFDKVWRRDGTKITFEEFFTKILNKYAPQVNAERAIGSFFRDYERSLLFASPLPGVTQFIQSLPKRYKTAIVTASTARQTLVVLRHNKWKNFFNAIVSIEDYKKPKPDPTAYLVAAKKLKIVPDNCLVIEDSRNGALSGKAAGMQVVGVRAGNKHKIDLSASDKIIKSLTNFKL